MSQKPYARKQKTDRLQSFLHTFFPEDVEQGELEVNGWLLVKFRPDKRYPNTEADQSRVELYRLPLAAPHGRF